MEGITICKERTLSEKELDDLVRCSWDGALQVFRKHGLENEMQEEELKKQMDVIVNQLKTANRVRQQRKEQLTLSALAVVVCTLLN